MGMNVDSVAKKIKNYPGMRRSNKILAKEIRERIFSDISYGGKKFFFLKRNIEMLHLLVTGK